MNGVPKDTVLGFTGTAFIGNIPGRKIPIGPWKGYQPMGVYVRPELLKQLSKTAQHFPTKDPYADFGWDHLIMKLDCTGIS